MAFWNKLGEISGGLAQGLQPLVNERLDRRREQRQTAVQRGLNNQRFAQEQAGNIQAHNFRMDEIAENDLLAQTRDANAALQARQLRDTPEGMNDLDAAQAERARAEAKAAEARAAGELTAQQQLQIATAEQVKRGVSLAYQETDPQQGVRQLQGLEKAYGVDLSVHIAALKESATAQTERQRQAKGETILQDMIKSGNVDVDAAAAVRQSFGLAVDSPSWQAIVRMEGEPVQAGGGGGGIGSYLTPSTLDVTGGGAGASAAAPRAAAPAPTAPPVGGMTDEDRMGAIGFGSPLQQREAGVGMGAPALRMTPEEQRLVERGRARYPGKSDEELLQIVRSMSGGSPR